MKKVLIGTPAHDGRVEVYYVNSLLATIKNLEKHFSMGKSKNYKKNFRVNEKKS